MKTITKLSRIFAVLAMFIVLDACKGPAGDVGPAGPAGPTGATGVAGPKGDTGNANAIQYTFASRTHTGSNIVYNLTEVRGEVLNRSIILVYIANTSGNWYSIPGIFNGTNEYRTISSPSTNSSTVTLVRVAGGSGGTDTFNSTRIVILPITDLRNGRKAAIDFSDYEAVKNFYNLKD
jgi:hypothetical protein